jgi:hypothetical protein
MRTRRHDLDNRGPFTWGMLSTACTRPRAHQMPSQSSSFSSESLSQSWWWPVPLRSCQNLRACAAKKEELPSSPRPCVTLNLDLGAPERRISVQHTRHASRGVCERVLHQVCLSVLRNATDGHSSERRLTVAFTHQKKRKKNMRGPRQVHQYAFHLATANASCACTPMRRVCET